MEPCGAWEIWKIRHHIVDTVLIVNLTPLEGIPYSNGRPDERVSVFLEESDLLERAGVLRNEELAGVTRSYLGIRGHTPSAT